MRHLLTLADLKSAEVERIFAITEDLKTKYEQGLREPQLKTGNMSAQRDFTDVRDVASAYLSILQRGEAGQVYNVCSGQPKSVQAMLELMLRASTARITTIDDPSRYRAGDTPISFGNHERLSRTTGWQPKYSFEKTIQDILDDWRMRVRAGERGLT